MRRSRVLGWEAGAFYENAPSDANLTLTSGAARTGGYGLRVNALSGVKSTLIVTGNTPATVSVGFVRAYLKVVSLPSAARSILTINGATPGASNPDLVLNPGGTLSLRQNGVVFATSPSALATGRWVRVELGLAAADRAMSLRLDGNVEIDWTVPTSGSGTVQLTSISLGAHDTVASAFECHWDDLAFDSRRWPGNGRVVARKVTGLYADNANFTAVGAASKWQAVAELPPDDDTSYLTTGTVNNQTIRFTCEGWPSGAKWIRGQTIYARHKRDGASNGFVLFSSGFADFPLTNSTAVSTGASYLTTPVTGYTANNNMGPYWTKEFLDAHVLAIISNGTTPNRISALWIEMDYDDDAAALPPTYPQVLSTFEDGLSDLAGFVNGGSATGSVVQSSDHAVSGSYSMKVTHASGGRSYFALGTFADFWPRSGELRLSFWFWVAAMPTSGAMDLLWLTTGAFRVGAVVLNADGSLDSFATTVAGSGAATAAGLVTTGKWHHLGVRFRAAQDSVATATGGQIEVILNGKTVHLRTGCNIGVNSFNSLICNIGSGLNVTGGGVVYYEDLIYDAAAVHTPNARLARLAPTGAGAASAASLTAVGTASKWDALDDAPNDGDASYVNTGTVNAASETYQTADLPASAKRVWGAQMTTVMKQDVSVTTFNVYLAEQGRPFHTSNLYTASTGSTYKSKGQQMYESPSQGEWQPSIINAGELGLRTASTVAARVTALWLTVVYIEYTPRAASRSAAVQVLG